MKTLMTALYIHAALATFGTAMGDGEGGERWNTLPPGCPLSSTPEVWNIPSDVLLEKARGCVWNDRFRIITKDANTTESYLTAMKVYCDGIPISRQCLAETNSLSELCLDEREQALVNLQGKLILEIAVTSCADEGVRLATIIEGTRPLVNASENVYKTCFHKAAHILDNETEDDIDASVFSMAHYKLMKNFKDCLVDSGSGTTWKVDIAISLLDDIMKEVVCIQEHLGPEVLCATIYTGE